MTHNAQQAMYPMDVERIAKPLKHQILTKERNMLGDKKATVLLRVSENLRFLFEAKQALRAAIYDSQSANGVVVVYVDGHCAACRYAFMMRLWTKLVTKLIVQVLQVSTSLDSSLHPIFQSLKLPTPSAAATAGACKAK